MDYQQVNTISSQITTNYIVLQNLTVKGMQKEATVLILPIKHAASVKTN